LGAAEAQFVQKWSLYGELQPELQQALRDIFALAHLFCANLPETPIYWSISGN
jgi:hypothetical protein